MAAAPLTAEEAMAKAEKEGLPLVRSDNNQTRYKGVTFQQGKMRPYRRRLSQSVGAA